MGAAVVIPMVAVSMCDASRCKSIWTCLGNKADPGVLEGLALLIVDGWNKSIKYRSDFIRAHRLAWLHFTHDEVRPKFRQPQHSS
jgi:hypothetical protein